MKSFLLQAAAVAVFAFVYPVLCAGNHPLTPVQTAPVQQPPAAEAEQAEPDSTQTDVSVSEPDTPSLASRDADTPVVLLDGETVKTLSMDAYLPGVVAAEMPASFEPEALKAQAVAARTYTLYCQQFCADKHENADVCSAPACCKAYADESTLRARWGADYDAYSEKIAQAVAATDGEYLTYEDEPILAVFHSSSNGTTEDSKNVWGTALPYLKSVKSPETSEEVPGYETSMQIAPEEFRETVLARYSDAVLDGAPAGWFGPAVRDASGRLETIAIGGVDISGTALRSLFALRSADIDVTPTDDSITLTTTGYGHGVGMSQYGANTLAKEGKTYAEILSWYYTDARLCTGA